MRKFVPLAAAVVLLAGTALANITGKDSTGATVTLATLAVNGVNYAQHVLVDATGAAFGTTTNPINVATMNGATAAAQAAGNVSLATIATNGATAAGQAPLTAPGTAGATATTVTTFIPQLTSTDIGGTFTATASQLAAANPNRHFIQIQVQGATDSTGTKGCWLSGLATATPDFHSLFIPLGGYYESGTHVTTGALSLVCDTSRPVYGRQG